MLQHLEQVRPTAKAVVVAAAVVVTVVVACYRALCRKVMLSMTNRVEKSYRPIRYSRQLHRQQLWQRLSRWEPCLLSTSCASNIF